MQLSGSGAIRLMRRFGCSEQSKVTILAVEPDLRLPLAALLVEAYAFEAARVVCALDGVAKVLRVRGTPQVDAPIVQPVAVHVVDLHAARFHQKAMQVLL